MLDNALAVQSGPDDIRSEIATAAKTVPDKVKGYVVTIEALEISHAFLRSIRAYRNKWADFMDPHIEGAMDAKRTAEANRKRLVNDKDLLDVPLAMAEADLAKKIGECEEKAKQIEEERKKAAELAAQKEAEDRLLAEAVALEEEALTAPTREEADLIYGEMEQVLEAPPVAQPVVFESLVPKKTGVSAGVEQWSADVHDLSALLLALIADDKKKKDGKGTIDKPLKDDLLKRIREAIMPPLNTRARTLRSAMAIPGVQAKCEKGYRIRS